MAKPLIDFGPAAGDYARHRPGFPDDLFESARTYGIGLAGQRVLDIGTGTGTLARGFAQRGCITVGLDPSAEMLAAATGLAVADKIRVGFVRAWAEASGTRAGSFDVVCAGQCWHWFDRARAAAEVKRVLRAEGRVLIAYYTYLSDPGSVGAATEKLILHHNPTWQLAGSDGRPAWISADLEAGGLRIVDTFEHDLPAIMSHEAWRGRIRACNGVLTMEGDHGAAFDADLAALLRRDWPEPLNVMHRLYAIVAAK